MKNADAELRFTTNGKGIQFAPEGFACEGKLIFGARGDQLVLTLIFFALVDRLEDFFPPFDRWLREGLPVEQLVFQL